MNDGYTLAPLGENAVIVRFEHSDMEEALAKVRSFSRMLESSQAEEITEYVPSYASVTVFYDPLLLYRKRTEHEDIPVFRMICRRLQAMLQNLKANVQPPGKIVEIPVCYGGGMGPDLPEVSRHAGLSEDEAVRLHASAAYSVAMIGFMPGFPYLSGLPEQLAVPRLPSPRLRIPQGSVAIGGKQTGIYPFDSPGGWRIIGRSPLKLFDAGRDRPALLEQGQSVRFVPITSRQFADWEEAPSC